MSTSLLPILSMLTSGTLGDMLSPSKSIEEKQKNTWRDTNDLIAWNCVVYVGLDSLSDPMVGSAIGALFLSDLACVAGARYNFEGTEPPVEVGEAARKVFAERLPLLGLFFQKTGDEKPRTVNIFVDEAAEVVNTPFLQILNKGRGAHLNGPLFSFRKEEMLDCYAGSVLKTDVLLKLIAASFELIGESYSSSLRRITDFRSGARTMEISDGSVFSTWMPSTSCLLCSSASACAFAGPERS